MNFYKTKPGQGWIANVLGVLLILSAFLLSSVIAQGVVVSTGVGLLFYGIPKVL